MREELIAFQTAKLAKEKGFDESCYDCYNPHGMQFSNGWCEYIHDNDIEIPFDNEGIKEKDILAPTQSLLQRWLREVHNIRVLVGFETIDDSTTDYTYNIVRDIPEGKGRKKDTWDFYEISYSFNQGGGWYDTYEEALEKGLYQALNLIK